MASGAARDSSKASQPSAAQSQGTRSISFSPAIECRVHHDVEWPLLGLVEGLSEINAKHAQDGDDDAADEIDRNDEARPPYDLGAVSQRAPQNVQTISEGEQGDHES